MRWIAIPWAGRRTRRAGHPASENRTERPIGFARPVFVHTQKKQKTKLTISSSLYTNFSRKRCFKVVRHASFRTARTRDPRLGLCGAVYGTAGRVYDTTHRHAPRVGWNPLRSTRIGPTCARRDPLMR